MAQGNKSQHLGGLEAWVASLWTAELHRKTISKKQKHRKKPNKREKGYITTDTTAIQMIRDYFAINTLKNTS